MPDDDVLKEATESLGVLPETGMERAKGIVLVEGKSDVTFLRHAASSFKQSGVLPASVGSGPDPSGRSRAGRGYAPDGCPQAV